jgi:hypothetical protein
MGAFRAAFRYIAGMKGQSLEVRFWSKVKKAGPDDCWMWTGSVWHVGYGTIWRDRKQAYAHRTAYELAHGAIPDGMCVCHRCDVKLCVNPAHLFLGTSRENFLDMVDKRRNARGEMLRQKLTAQKVRAMRAAYAMGASQSALAREYNVNQSCVSRTVRGKHWAHITE